MRQSGMSGGAYFHGLRFLPATPASCANARTMLYPRYNCLMKM
jgi:hypothetical protein